MLFGLGGYMNIQIKSIFLASVFILFIDHLLLKMDKKSLLIWLGSVCYLFYLFPVLPLPCILPFKKVKNHDFWAPDEFETRALDHLSFEEWNHQYTKDKERKKGKRKVANFLFSFITKRPLTFLHGIPKNPLVAKGILCAAPLTILVTLVRNITTNI